MNEVEQLLEKLKHYYGVGTYQEVAQNLGVARNTVSGWISRNSLKSIKRKIYELKLPIDFDMEQSSFDDEIEDIYSLILDDAAYNAKDKLQRKFDNDMATFVNTYLAQNLLPQIIEDLSSDKHKYTPHNTKEEFLSRLQDLEVGLLKKPGQKLLSVIIEKYFSKLQVYAMIHQPEIVFNYKGYWK